jgi:hypothetical protein
MENITASWRISKKETNTPMNTEEQFQVTINSFKHREPWLHAVAERLREIFAFHGATIPEKIRFTCGFPSARAFSARKQFLGQCWSEANSADGHFEIMISPVLDDPMRVAGVLAHELVHATVGTCHGHKGPFAKLAKAIGLEGRMTATTEGQALKQALAPILEAVGPLPPRRAFPEGKGEARDTAHQAAMSNLPVYGEDHSEVAS